MKENNENIVIGAMREKYETIKTNYLMIESILYPQGLLMALSTQDLNNFYKIEQRKDNIFVPGLSSLSTKNCFYSICETLGINTVVIDRALFVKWSTSCISEESAKSEIVELIKKEIPKIKEILQLAEIFMCSYEKLLKKITELAK